MSNHIETVSLEPFNKQSATHHLAPGVNFIHGPNGSGKTSIWQAIEFATTGRVTGLPKKNADIMAACGSGSLSLEAEVVADIGNTVPSLVSRKLTRKGASVTAKASGPQNLIAQICIDLEPFMSASAKTRAAMIVQACGGDLTAMLENAFLKSGLKPYLQPLQPTETVSEWLKEVNAKADAAASLARDQVKTMKGTLQGVEALDEDPPMWSGPSVEALRATTARLHTTIAACQGKLSVYQRKIQPIPPMMAEPTETAERLDALAKEQSDKLFTLKESEQKHTITSQQHARWNNSLMCIQVEIEEINKEIEAAPTPEQDLSLIESKLQELNAEATKLNEELLNAAKDELAGMTQCPCCGANKAHWQRQNDGLKTQEELEAIRARLDDVLGNIQELREDQAYAKNALAAQAKLEAAKRRLADMEGMKPEVSPPVSAEAISAAGVQLYLTNDKIGLRKAWQEYRAAFGEYQQAQSQISEEQRLSELAQAELVQAEADLQAAIEASQQRQDREARVRLKAEADERLAAEQKKLTAITTAKDDFTKLVNEQLDSVLRGVVATCKQIGQGFFPDELRVIDLEIGYYDGDKWTSFDAMNASNKRIAAIAIQAALAAQATGIKVVCIDEFGIVDDSRKEQVIANLAEACRLGILDQVLILDNRPLPFDAADVNMISL